LSWNVLRSLCAFLVVFITTADDTIWLIPMLSTNKFTTSARVIHASVFCCTLQVACLASWLFCLVFGSALEATAFSYKGKEIETETVLNVAAIILTWLLALGLFIKSMRKKWLRSQRPLNEMQTRKNYGTIENDFQDSDALEDDSPLGQETVPQIATVGMLTLTGALDEMICFPSFILAGTFSYPELAFGCLSACLIILAVVTLIINTCKPLLDLFDRIPLYAIISVYAVILTLSYAAE